MVILKAIDTEQEISVYVREHTATLYDVFIIDEGLNDEQATSDVTGTYIDGLLTLNVTYDFIEDNFYMLQIFADSELIGYHKIYITNQMVYDKYSVLNDYYSPIVKPETNYITKPE